MPWIYYGIIASLLWGAYIVIIKISTGSGFGVDNRLIPFLMLIGIAMVFLMYTFFDRGFEMPKNKWGAVLAVVAGAFWALGMVASVFAITSGADVSKLAPIYNTNTLVTVFLGIILLKELPHSTELIKTILGAVLIVIGAVVISL